MIRKAFERWPQKLLDHWPQKLGALVLASLIWLFISTSETTTSQRSLLVPLAVEGVGERRVAVGLPEFVEVTILGPSNRIDRLRPENIEAVLELTGLQGEFQQAIDVRPPQGIELVRVNPDDVIGFLEAVADKQVEVEPVWLGSPPADSTLTSTSEPATINVSARTEILERVALALAPVPAEPGEVSTRIFAVDASGIPIRDVTLTPSTVTVTTSAQPMLVRRERTLVLDEPELTRVATAELSRATAVIAGPASALDEIETVVARVEPETVPTSPGRYDLPVRLELPAGAFAVDAPTASVVVTDPSLPE